MDVCSDCALRLFNTKHHNLQGIGNPYFGICIVIPNVDYDAYKKGNIGYSEYEGNVSVKKDITSIVLSKVENEEDFKATFSQTILVDSKSIGKKNEEKGTMTLDAYVVDYVGSPKIDGERFLLHALGESQRHSLRVCRSCEAARSDIHARLEESCSFLCRNDLALQGLVANAVENINHQKSPLFIRTGIHNQIL